MVAKSAFSFVLLLLPLQLANLPTIQAAQYTCGGIRFDSTDNTNRCQDSRGAGAMGQAALRDMFCPKDRSWGCEQYTDAMGTREFFCCPQLCDDAAKTRIDLRTPQRCTNNVCTTDTSKVCKHVSTGEDYCCPAGIAAGIPSAGSTGTGAVNPVSGQSSSLCEDHRTDCEAKADLCIIEYAYERMYRDCPKTCNVCGGECKDLGTDCADRKRDGYCDRAVYHDLMNWQCPKSCDRCDNRRPPRGNPMMARGGR